MEILFYFLIFIMGTLFGSFFSLAVYRIPIKESIMYGRSYCPKCNHKLQILDLIPVLSYIFLGGKCRYCKERIRPRYIFLELVSGFTFLLFALSLKIDIYNIEINKLVYLGFGMLYLSALFVIAGIDKEKHNIQNSVLLFGLIVQIVYIIYLYIIGTSIYKYVIYLFLILLLLGINTIILRKNVRKNYMLQITILSIYFLMFAKEETVILGIILAVLMIFTRIINISYKNKKKNILENNRDYNIPVGFYLCVCNIITLILQNYIF